MFCSPVLKNSNTGRGIMITRRDVVGVALGVAVSVAITAMAQSAPPIMKSAAFDWNSIPEKKEEIRSVRQFFKAPTATLDELELHVTTLGKGDTSHAPHRHPNEELVIVKEGTVEVLVSGEWKRVGSGSVIFNASNELHALRNVGDGPAVYHVINWRSPGAKQ